MQINTVEDFERALENGPYAHGGYPCFFVCADGDALSYAAAKENAELVQDAIECGTGGWKVIAFVPNWEDAHLFCSHSNERIPSAYAEDEAVTGEQQ